MEGGGGQEPGLTHFVPLLLPPTMYNYTYLLLRTPYIVRSREYGARSLSSLRMLILPRARTAVHHDGSSIRLRVPLLPPFPPLYVYSPLLAELC